MSGGKVLIFRLEGHPAEWIRTLQAFGADPERVFIADNLPHGPQTMNIVDEIITTLRPDLVIVDTLASLAALTGLISSATGDSLGWTDLINRLAEIASRTGAAMIVLHHVRKAGDEYRDSTAIGAAPDQILIMKRSPDNPNVRTIEPIGRWYIPPFAVQLVDGVYSLVPRGEVAIGIHERIVAYVRENPGVNQRTVREALDGRFEEVSAAVHRLLSDGRIVNTGSERAFKLEVPEPAGDDSVEVSNSETPASAVVPVKKGSGISREPPGNHLGTASTGGGSLDSHEKQTRGSPKKGSGIKREPPGTTTGTGSGAVYPPMGGNTQPTVEPTEGPEPGGNGAVGPGLEELEQEYLDSLGGDS